MQGRSSDRRPSLDRKSFITSVKSVTHRPKSEASHLEQENRHEFSRRMSSLEFTVPLNFVESDDDVPEIDYSDPIHSVRRSAKTSRSSVPTYESLLREQTLDEFNRELYTFLKKGEKTRGEVSSENTKEAKRKRIKSQ